MNENNKIHMEMEKVLYGPIPDSLFEPSLIKKHPQLSHPFMYMVIRLIVAVLTVFA